MFLITQAKNAQDGTAWKAPAMRGYVFKTALDKTTEGKTTYGEGAWKLTFRKAEDSGGDPVDYDFYFDSTSGTSSVNLVLTKELLVYLASPSWQQGTATDFEAARTAASGGDW